MPKKDNSKLISFFKRHRKTILVVLIVLALLIFTLFVYERNQRKSEQERLAELAVQAQPLDTLIDNDTDGDGIPDWKERLLGTNPLAFDTNSDGVSDYEIAAATQTVLNTIQLNALREQFPELSEREILELAKSQSPTKIENNNLTDKLAVQFAMLESMLSGINEPDPAAVEAINEALLQDTLEGLNYPTLDPSDVANVSETDIYSVVAYFDLLIDIVTKRKETLEVDPRVTLAETLETEDQAKLERGSKIAIQELDSILNQLVRMSVPSRYREEHVSLINAYLRVRSDMIHISQYYNDPVLGYAAYLASDQNTELVITVENLIIETIQADLEEFINSPS